MSRANNTRAITEIIHEKAGGKLVPLELEGPYPENYQAIVKQVMFENRTGYQAHLTTKIDTIAQY